jgi:hypothetical protein
MHGYDVVTNDDHKIGTVVDERDDCLIVEHGHVFKARHAIPKAFVHVDGETNVVRATITKDIFEDSPKVGDDWDCDAVLRHYGVVGTFEVDPDPESPEGITTDDHSQERVAIREGRDVGNEVPKVRERMASADDPAGVSANLRSR